MNSINRYSENPCTLEKGFRRVRLTRLIVAKIVSFFRSYSSFGFLACFSLVLFFGCGTEKESLFEEDHEVPAHWPRSLSDAANKIDQHLKLLSTQPDKEQYESELCDLVLWTPEVAADSDLTEQQWMPIYDMCEIMRTHLASGDVSPLDIEGDFRKLQALLIESVQLLGTAAETMLPGSLDVHDDNSVGDGDEVLNSSQSSEEDDPSTPDAEDNLGEVS